MVSQHDALDSTDLSASCIFTERCEHFDIAYSDFDDDWTHYDEQCMLSEELHDLSPPLGACQCWMC